MWSLIQAPVIYYYRELKLQLVKRLCNDTFIKGHHKLIWDGKDRNGNTAGSGVYLIRMETKNKSITRKAMMIK